MHYDVVIIGAGPAGLSFARSLGTSDLRVLVVEKATEASLREPVEDGREIALTHQSVELMQQSGAWDQLREDDIAPICAARVVDGDSDYSLDFDNQRQDLEALGYLVPNHAIRQAYYEATFGADQQHNITLMTDTSVTDLGSCDEHAWVMLSDGTRVQCDLLVSADSRFSETRRKMGIAATMNDFSRSAIVCRMDHTGDHEQTAIECFHYGHTLALLPMAGNRSSIVVTVGSDEAEAIQKMSDAEFEADIEQRLKGQLGSMKLCGPRHLYPLVGVHAKRFVARRFAVIGDAAVGMHPVTAHGFNLGLKSQETLSKAVLKAASKSQDIGAASLLEGYQRSHMLATRPIYHGTNLVVGLFTDDRLPAKLARKLTMRLANNCAPLKQLITAKLTEKGLPSLRERLPDLPAAPAWLPRF
ncbi:5-demethoxyubiquinol-8 5-hydroxylase UbiM [Aliamphritea hakodatensis]|uniref:5-demethoxyubiquinol-8 5-hydroxylase UbiM n=1 Tax=Aliamphritea hakodatensis TaxID=2895352 RepID=UPI0022FD92D1|nr:5-demethoxyubiquinol-8 5-hydroxylase UbiM [Aliamphritea hakodatensis]